MYYYIRTISFQEEYKLPIIFNSRTSKPVFDYLSFLIFNQRFKLSSNSLKLISYSISKFYNFLNLRNISADKLANIDSKKCEQLIIGFSIYVVDISSRKKQAISYKNSILKNLLKYLNYLKNEYNTSFNIDVIQPYIVTRRKTYTSNSKKSIANFDNSYRDTLIKISQPRDLNNPFNTKNLQFRNHVIILILINTGIRIGELMSITINDYKEIQQRFYIDISDRNIQGDRRHSPASIKNIYSYRTISISKDLFVLIDYYVLNIRKYQIKENRSNLLFISEKGFPVSKQTILRIIKELNLTTNKLLNKDIKITTHSFRYDFANQFLKYLLELEKLNMTSALEQLRVIMGWHINSTMPSKYANIYISKHANTENLNRVNSSYESI